MTRYYLFIVAALALVMMSGSAFAGTWVVNYPLQNLGDAKMWLGAADTNYGAATDLILGVQGGNFSIIVKFNLSAIPAFANITNAELFLYSYGAFGAGNPNATVWGTNNQTWDEAYVTYTIAATQIMVDANNITSETYNSTMTNGWWRFNVTPKIQWYKSQGFTNGTLYVNVSHAGWADTRDYCAFRSKEYADYPDARYKPVLNVTYFLIEDINITRPGNITYYNNFTLPLNVSNNTFSSINWTYSLDGDSNVSFTPNTTISIPPGVHHILVCANDSADVWYCVYAHFTTAIVCNATYNNVSVCTGADSMFISPCLFEDGIWQFSNYNMTRCDGSCFNGACKKGNTICFNQCNVSMNQMDCSGNSNNFAINCTYDSNGCQVWNQRNSTFCEYGCFHGACLNCTDECTIGETKCIGDYTYDCRQIGNCSAWDLSNGTFCEYGCFKSFDSTTSTMHDYCNYHSFGDTYNISKGIWIESREIGLLFPDARSQSFIVIMLAIFVALFLMLKTRKWMVGVFAAIGIMWLGALAGWLDYFTLVLFTALGVFILWASNKNGGGEE